MDQARHCKIGTVEKSFIGQKTNPCSSIALTTLPYDGQIFDLIAALKRHAVDIAIATNRNIEPLGKRIYYRHAHSMQTATELVILVREFTTGVQR